jgi:hypothetical protein
MPEFDRKDHFTPVTIENVGKHDMNGGDSYFINSIEVDGEPAAFDRSRDRIRSYGALQEANDRTKDFRLNIYRQVLSEILDFNGFIEARNGFKECFKSIIFVQSVGSPLQDMNTDLR